MPCDGIRAGVPRHLSRPTAARGLNIHEGERRQQTCMERARDSRARVRLLDHKQRVGRRSTALLPPGPPPARNGRQVAAPEDGPVIIGFGG